MNISNSLTALAADINALLDRDEKNRAEWVDIKLDLCRRLTEVRAKFPDNQSFGRWFTDTIGSAISHQDRAAYVAMGEHPDVAREVLEKTMRSSIRHIYEQEFKPRFTHVSKPRREYKKTVSPEMGRDLAAAYLDEGKTLEQVTEEADLASVQHVKIAVAREEGRREAQADADLMATPLSASSQKVIDAYKRKLDKEFERSKAKWQAEINEKLKQWHVAWLQERIEEYREKERHADMIIASQRGIFAPKDFKMIRSCLHPDSRKSASDERLAEAFRLFNEAERALVKDETLSKSVFTSLTLDELAARKAARTAENSARAKAAHAARKETNP